MKILHQNSEMVATIHYETRKLISILCCALMLFHVSNITVIDAGESISSGGHKSPSKPFSSGRSESPGSSAPSCEAPPPDLKGKDIQNYLSAKEHCKVPGQVCVKLAGDPYWYCGEVVTNNGGGAGASGNFSSGGVGNGYSGLSGAGVCYGHQYNIGLQKGFAKINKAIEYAYKDMPGHKIDVPAMIKSNDIQIRTTLDSVGRALQKTIDPKNLVPSHSSSGYNSVYFQKQLIEAMVNQKVAQVRQQVLAQYPTVESKMNEQSTQLEAELNKHIKSIEQQMGEITKKMEDISHKALRDSAAIQREIDKNTPLETNFDPEKVAYSPIEGLKKDLNDIQSYFHDPGTDINYDPPKHNGMHAPDTDPITQLYEIRSMLLSSNPSHRSGIMAKQIGLTAADQSYEFYQAGNKELGVAYKEAAKTMLDVVLGFVPVMGWGRDIYESISGTNLITGKELTTTEQAFAIFGALSLGIGSKVKLSTKFLAPFVQNLKEVGSKFVSKFQKASGIVNKWIDASQKVKPRLGNKYVRHLPDRPEKYADSFEGHIFKGTYEPGEILFQAQRTGQKGPGRWFAPVKPINAQHADEMLFLKKYGNDAGQIKTYVVKERVSGYAGKVKNGTGHQFYVPEDVPLNTVIEEVVLN